MRQTIDADNTAEDKKYLWRKRMAKKEGKEHPTIFISYSHEDKDWVRNWLVPKLEASGVQTHIDYRDFEIGVPSVVNMERAVEQCEKTILVLTPHWVKSEWTQFEGIMLQTMDPIGVRKKILPVMLEDCQLPTRLGIFTYADCRNKEQWDFQVGRLVKQIQKDFAKLKMPEITYLPLDEERVNIWRLPKRGYELFGRQEELKLLDGAWELGKINVLSFVAYGGTGKSTLVNKWLERMRWDNYRGAERVYGWSFYSQGIGERATSADMFINEALKWFGDTNPTEGSEREKGKRLARLVCENKTLLILDGMEPLQSGLIFDKGKIKDNALAMLVTELAKENNGLCVITTREDIPELTRYAQTVKVINVEQISDEAGKELLKVRDIQGTDEQLEQATRDFGNHALAINLLASYLHGIAGHHISNAAEIADIDVPVEEGRHPHRVMEAFDKRFGKGVKREILRIMGLFDRPAELKAIEAVRAAPAIEGLTGYLQGLKETEWTKLLEELRDCKLLALKSKHNPDVVDCHPLIREHFGEKLKKEKQKAWREAHGRLYEYYKGVPEKEEPDTIEEMEPLFRAVYHGCAAGKYQETFGDVYSPRIRRRGMTNYCCSMLGAFGSDLGAVACFFERCWDRPAAGLSEHWKALVLNWAGFRLYALGRLRESAEPMGSSLQRRIEQENWIEAAKDANNLSELYLTLGKVEKAVEYGHKCVEYADKSRDAFERMGNRTTLADALFWAGEIGEAKRLFEEAEEMQKKDQPGYEYLYSMGGYRYCDLLLALGEYEEVKERVRQTLEWAKEYLGKGLGLWDIGLDKLSLGRAELGISKIKGQKSNIKIAEKYLNEAVDGLRKAGAQHCLPWGLLVRAGYYRGQRSWDEARGDLEEAREIAERGEMKLHLADYHLESARLCLAQAEDRSQKSEVRISKEKEEGKNAKWHYEEARRLVEECGYHRRDKELEELEKECGR